MCEGGGGKKRQKAGCSRRHEDPGNGGRGQRARESGVSNANHPHTMALIVSDRVLDSGGLGVKLASRCKLKRLTWWDA